MPHEAAPPGQAHRVRMLLTTSDNATQMLTSPNPLTLPRMAGLRRVGSNAGSDSTK